MADGSAPVESIPFQLAADNGHRFCLLHRPRGTTTRGALLFLPPFAEEMNRSRRAVAESARVFAGAGFAVLQIDLRGSGDSTGELEEVSWNDWLVDAERGLEWLQREFSVPCWLWGLRSGTLLATAMLARTPHRDLLLWQPVFSGQQFVNQFLRLRVAREMANEPGERGNVQALRAALSGGATVEVAGYSLRRELLDGFDAATLDLPARHQRHVVLLEVSSREPPALSPRADACVSEWRAQGASVECDVVKGNAFWQTQEIEESPALASRSCAALVRDAEGHPA